MQTCMESAVRMRRSRVKRLIGALMIGWLSGCGGSGETSPSSASAASGPSSAASAPQESTYGGIPSSNFDLLAAPTVDAFVLAYEVVTAIHPEADSDNSKLAQLVFDFIKESPSEPGKIFPAEHQLTKDEFKLSMLHVKTSYLAYTTVPIAENSAQAAFPCSTAENYVDDKADAIRHAYWHALMTSRVGQPLAYLIGVAHEADKQASASSAMDLHNNLVGENLAAKNPAASDETLLTLVETQPMLKVLPAYISAAPASVLVYFQGSQLYDGTMKGSIARAGGLSDSVSLDLSQCDFVLRGLMTQIHGTATYRRRFRGLMDERGHASLTLDDPYPFENSGSDSQCLGIEMQLAGNVDSLSGSWTSSNCGANGAMSISR